ncbi:FtsK/SpoIIIE domain-containing protein [Mycobacterium sp. 155]|uniref:FtsK/SpoIIIE domain-containing protein n=1 Tax=Mycobacterium sp. 155 TaxID=1157943 RepID=UPI0003A9DD27|nr:FtsK/SpoIIIE domain-containing protein [Mycobacterium sp. 155]
MADIDALLGRSGAARAARPAPEPAQKKAKAKAGPRLHVADETETDGETVAPTGPSAAAAKAAQQAAITSAVDELAALWRQIEAGAQCPEPQRVDADATAEESPERVARLWTARFEREDWRRHLFGCNAPALARVDGLGVAIKAEIGPDMDTYAAIATFQQAALNMGAGRYEGKPLPGVGPRGGQLVLLWRSVVGVDPATAFRAVNHNAYLIYADLNQRREALWFNAGLAVKKIDRRYAQKPKQPTVYRYEFPQIIECLADTGRGPGFVVEMHREQAREDFEAALPKLRGLLRCDLKLIERKPGLVEIQLLHRAKANWPAQTPLSPSQLWRPRSKAEALLAARDGILVPVGVTQEGRPLMLDLRRRPHLLLTGTSGAGKSTLFRLMLRALQLQLGVGGTLILADGKGADMVAVYGEGIGQNLSVEDASIHRAIAYLHDELLRRKRIYKKLVARRLPDKFPLLVLCFDEFGAWAGRGLATGSSKRRKAGVEAAMEKLRFILRQGRSLGIHVLLSTQDVTVESGINTALLSVVSSRIVVGQVQGGSGSAMDKLFSASERPRVAEAGAHIRPGDMGMGVMVDEDGEVVAFKAFYNGGQAAEILDAAVAAGGRASRFAWKFPDDGGEWLLRTCAAFEDTDPVDDIPTIALEDEHGRYIAEHGRYDEGNAEEHDPGTPDDNAAHSGAF